MLRDARRRSDQFEEVLAPVHWFHGTDAQAADGRFAQNGAQQIDEADTAWEVAAPTA